jgi:hypothetical protein
MKILDQLQAKRKSRRRDREKAERLTGADVLVVSHGKSGRTWLRTLISNLYHQKYGIPESQLINYDNFTVQALDIPKIAKAHSPAARSPGHCGLVLFSAYQARHPGGEAAQGNR